MNETGGALVHLADAVNDARTLYQQSASAHWALLAHCLSSKATALVIAEKLNDAYTDLKEAVGLVPADSAENSGAEAKGIADRYLNFGIVALELNRFEEAHVAGQRAEVLYRWLAESDPSRYEDALSTVAELQQKAAPGLRSSSDKYTASSA